jgi:hypothetical protein
MLINSLKRLINKEEGRTVIGSDLWRLIVIWLLAAGYCGLY